MPEGSALLLPAFWYHEVESTQVDHAAAASAEAAVRSARPNVAVNVWFDGGTAARIRHGVLRERLAAKASAA